MNYRIRQATNNDYNSICNLVLEVHKLHLNNRPDVYLDTDTPINKGDFEKILTLDDTFIFVVENEDTKFISAYTIIKILNTKNPLYVPNRFAYIDDFCVSSKYKRNGIGTYLFKYITEFVKEKNASSIQLNVWEFNDDAINFYESLGMSTRNRRMELNL